MKHSSTSSGKNDSNPATVDSLQPAHRHFGNGGGHDAQHLFPRGNTLAEIIYTPEPPQRRANLTFKRSRKIGAQRRSGRETGSCPTRSRTLNLALGIGLAIDSISSRLGTTGSEQRHNGNVTRSIRNTGPTQPERYDRTIRNVSTTLRERHGGRDSRRTNESEQHCVALTLSNLLITSLTIREIFIFYRMERYSRRNHST